MMADLKTALFNYLAQRHFDLMSSDVHDRFEEYDKNGSFISNMKEWKARFEGHPLVGLDTTITDPADWKKLYHALQQTFQAMNANKKHPYAYGSDYNAATRDFIERYFGDNSRTFTTDSATGPAEHVFIDFATWLENHKANLEIPLKDASVFTPEYKYDDFIKDIRDKKYNTNKDGFRDKLEALIQYVRYYQLNPDPSQLPVASAGGLVPDMNFAGLPTDPKDWYMIPDEAIHISQLQVDYAEIFDKLLTDATIRKNFLAVAKEPVKGVLETAIAKTDYENKESDDYLPPMPLDKKNLRQKIEKWKKDTYENHFRRFFDHNRGARKYYSRQSQNIMKALDKAGIKPTDGLDGIVGKKDDAKLRSVINQDPTTRKHFEWFIKQMETIKSEIPDAYEGAFRKGDQLRRVVMQLIANTKKEDMDKAKTALEILSVAKYGLTCSRTLEGVIKATKDMSIFSDKDLSWNKNEGIRFVTGAVDKTAGLAIRGLGLAATGIHNFIQHRRTKIGNDISKYKNLNDAYKKWQTEDATRLANLRASNAIHHIAAYLANLAAGGGASGRVIANDTDLEAAQTDWTLMAPGPARDNLETDIKLYKDMSDRQKHEDNWRKENPDFMSELVAHWNLLETYGKTHAFLLGSMKIKRDKMFEKDSAGKTKAQNIAEAYYKKFGNLRAA